MRICILSQHARRSNGEAATRRRRQNERARLLGSSLDKKVTPLEPPTATFVRMSAAGQILGRRGERVAEEYLAARGWRILDRRFRSGHRDIDLVVERIGGESRLIAFVEVKARASRNYGGPLGAVHWRKQREMAHAARDWMSLRRRAGDTFRFDVVGILFGGGRAEVVHVENAFTVR